MEYQFMKRALELAKKGVGFTSPNPAVGAVIVKGGQIVAEGWHKFAGAEHAEVMAMKEVMRKSGIVTRDFEPTLFHNATIYVTLEPCVHEGKTPPCVNALSAASFKTVYVGMKDPFKMVNGKGMRKLRKNGLDVRVLGSTSKLHKEIRSINQPFIKHAVKGLPYVTLKAGISLDGKIATASGDSKWITSRLARKDARLERSKFDAVLVGAGTVKADDPTLAADGKWRNKDLLRVIIDPKLSLGLGSKVFRDENVFVACTGRASVKNVNRFKSAGIKFKSFGEDKVSIKKLLKYLAKENIQSVFVEGGSSVNGAFFDAMQKDALMLDEVLFYVAPKLLGGVDSLPVIGGDGVESIKNAIEFEDFTFESLKGKELKIRGKINCY